MIFYNALDVVNLYFTLMFPCFIEQMGRSAGFNLGGSYASHRPQQQQQHAPAVSSSGVSFSPVNNQDLLHLQFSDIFPSSHSTFHAQVWYYGIRVVVNGLFTNAF